MVSDLTQDQKDQAARVIMSVWQLAVLAVECANGPEDTRFEKLATKVAHRLVSEFIDLVKS